MAAQHYSLADLPRALIEAGYEPVSYQRAYLACVSGKFPAQRGRGNRWTWNADDLPQIADALQLTTAFAA